MRCSIDRNRHSLSIWAASMGKCSQTWMPGVLVAMGLNSPRISAGASGFMSHRSMWLGPPNRKMKMQERTRRGSPVGVAARSRARSRLLKPNRLKPPARNSSRRDRDCPGRVSAKIESMAVALGASGASTCLPACAAFGSNRTAGQASHRKALTFLSLRFKLWAGY